MREREGEGERYDPLVSHNITGSRSDTMGRTSNLHLESRFRCPAARPFPSFVLKPCLL